MVGIKFEHGRKYHYEHMDLVDLLTFLNTIAIVFWNKGAYIGLPVAVFGLAYDLYYGCHWNNVSVRLSLIIMNLYFLLS